MKGKFSIAFSEEVPFPSPYFGDNGIKLEAKKGHLTLPVEGIEIILVIYANFN